MEWRGRFADVLEQLEERSSALGVTHYAVSMPTLEEVFLRCTAESHEHPPDSLYAPDGVPSASGGGGSGGPLPTDGHCEIAVAPRAKQPAVAAAAAAAAGSSADAAAGQSEHGCRGSSRPASPASADGSRLGEQSNRSSTASEAGAEGNIPEYSSGAAVAQLPISRDDSAEALSYVPEATEDARSDQTNCKTPERNTDRGAQGAPMAGRQGEPSSCDKQQNGAIASGEAATDGYGEVHINGREEAHCIEEDVLEEVPLHEPLRKPKRSRRQQWTLAFREMLRKRAIIAGELHMGRIFTLLLS